MAHLNGGRREFNKGLSAKAWQDAGKQQEMVKHFQASISETCYHPSHLKGQGKGATTM